MAKEKINTPESTEKHEKPISQAEKNQELADLLEKVKLDNPDNIKFDIEKSFNINGNIYYLLSTDTNGEKKYCIAKNGATIKKEDFKFDLVEKVFPTQRFFSFEAIIGDKYYNVDAETGEIIPQPDNVKKVDPNLSVRGGSKK